MGESKYNGLMCLECGYPIKPMAVTKASQTMSHKEECIGYCPHCLSSWKMTDEGSHGIVIERYFFGQVYK